MWGKVKQRNEELHEQIDEIDKQTEQNKARVKQTKELAHENSELEKKLANKPDPEEEARIVDGFRHVENEKHRLERELTTRQIREQELDKMRQDTERINVQNELNAKQLAEYNASMDVRNREEKEAIEARVMAEKQRELNEKKMQTYKSEQDKRMAEHELNAQQSDRIKAMDDQIVREHVKSEEARIEKERIEQLRRTQKQAREHQMAANAMRMVDVCTKGVNGFENLTAQLNAVQDKLITTADEKMRDDMYVKKKQDETIKELYDDPMMLNHVRKQYEQQGYTMFRSPDDLRARLNTREKVDQYAHWVNGLALTRPATPPPMRPGNIYRFVGTPQESSTMSMNVDDESDEE
jgi:hypothetical protein